MRILKSMVLAGLLGAAGVSSQAAACPGHKEAKPTEKPGADKPAPKKLASATFRVEGMHCGGCADKIKQGLGSKAGILKVEVKVADQRVVVDYDADQLTPDSIAKMITDVGYKASPEV